MKNYLTVIEQYLSLFEADGNEEHLYQLSMKMENLMTLAAEVKERIVEVRKLSQRLLFSVDLLPFWIKHSILSSMLEIPAIFKAADFEKASSLFDQALKNRQKRGDNFLMADTYLKTAEKIASKLNQDVRKWQNETGECYIRLADTETKKERLWLKLEYYTHAIIAFRKAGSIIRRQEAEQLYNELKPNVELSTFKLRYGEKTIEAMKKWQEEIKSTAEKVLTQTPDEIYAYIGRGNFFPNIEYLKKTTSNHTEHWLKGIHTIKFDINKNINNVMQREVDSEDEGLRETYQFQIQQTVLPFLHYIFIPGIKSGKLTYQNFIQYLEKNSWIGQTFIKTDLSGEQVQYNWLRIVAPAIIEYFVQMQAALLSNRYPANYILCIDSLALKMEGLFRDFSRKLNVSTSKGSKVGVQEKYLHELLKDEVVRSNFNEEDMLYFDYLFTGVSGIDLRNNIAHCFYDYSDYSDDKMHLLIAALLRIGKYHFEISKDGNIV